MLSCRLIYYRYRNRWGVEIGDTGIILRSCVIIGRKVPDILDQESCLLLRYIVSECGKVLKLCVASFSVRVR